jgi:hypothetical protein
MTQPANGWDDLDAGAVVLPADDRQELIDKLFVSALNNEPGKKLLAHWKRKYLDQPVCVPGASADHGFHREGQNSVIREAIQRLNRGLTPK